MQYWFHRIILFCIAFVMMVLPSFGQVVLQIKTVDSVVVPITKKNAAVYTTAAIRLNDATEIMQALQNKLGLARGAGHLTASMDSVSKINDSTFAVAMYYGPVYQWAQLNLDSLPVALLNKLNIRKIDWANQPLSPKRFESLCAALLRESENTGYPFAQVSLDAVQIKDHTVDAALVLKRNKLTIIDTVIIEGDVNVSNEFITNYLGIKNRSVYNESQLRLISQKLKELAFLQESEPWRLNFTIAGNELKLFLKPKRANQINGLIGLQPNDAASGKMLLTIDALLSLKNALGAGEQLNATFQKLQRNSQKLHIDGSYPYLFGMPFALDALFDLYKRDTLFMKINFEIGVRYLINSKDYVKLNYISESNNVIYADLPYVSRFKRLPDVIDSRNNGVGLHLNVDRTDYFLAPRKGWSAKILTQASSRRIKENNAIAALQDGSGFDYASLYDTFANNTLQYKLGANIAYYQPVLKTIIGKLGYQGGLITGGQLFLNELFQIGGYNLLRGFDEESIFANQYHIFTAEVRFMINTYSYFQVFSDGGWYQSKYGQVNVERKPLSFGAGVSLQNDAGIFKVAIAVGKTEATSFEFRQAKLHFGYVAFF